MQKGSCIPFVESLAAKGIPVENDNADSYLVSEIKCTELPLAAFVYQFLPNPIVYSSRVEWLVLRLVVIEAAL